MEHSKKCKKCGAINPYNANFCANCKNKFSSRQGITKDDNPIGRAASYWDRQNKGFKIFSGFLGCCIGAFIFIMLITLLFPMTSLALENSTVDIDNKTTEYLIKGKTDANSTVKISSKELNLSDVKLQASTDGTFEYRVSIPIEVTESEVKVTSKSLKKSENIKSVKISRPLTLLSVSKPPKIRYDAEQVNITGHADPYSEITIISADLQINNVKVTSDANGDFNTTLNISKDKSNVKITINAKTVGKKFNNQTIEVLRESPPATPVNNTTTTSNNPPVTSNTASGTPSSSSTSSSGSTSSPSTSSSSSSSSNSGGPFVGSQNSDVYHYTWCASAQRIKSYNKITFNNVQQAKNAHYRPCERCNPPG